MQVMKELFHVLEQWHYRLSIGWCGSGKSVRRRGKSDDVDQCIVSLYTFMFFTASIQLSRMYR